MDKILEFLDFSSIDPQMYWRIPTEDGAKTFEINWRRDNAVHWRFREFGALFWTLSTTESLMGDLRNVSIDLLRFEESVKTSLLHQVCFADRIVKDSRVLLSSELVDAAVADHEEFLRNIGAIVEKFKTTPPAAAPSFRLHVVKNEI
ncbi:MAG: hypothetical protein H7249_16440 [Chitinophagaceae bacterium]|nr:hypothetical protein [Oligoflexus sp.]